MAELNGAPVSPDVLQPLALVNYGHFTSMRVDDRKIRGLSHHLDRLDRDCRLLFNTPLDRDHVRTLIRSAIPGHGSCVIRVTIYDPHLELGTPGADAHPQLLVTTRPAPVLPTSPMRVRTTTYIRDLPEVKHTGLFGAIWERRLAQREGYDDALFLDRASFVTEGATWNIGFFDGDRVVWPSAEILAGVTMRLLTQVHDHTVTAPVNIRDLPRMRAAFATNTAIGVRPIAGIDSLELSATNPIFDILRKEYGEIPPEKV